MAPTDPTWWTPAERQAAARARAAGLAHECYRCGSTDRWHVCQADPPRVGTMSVGMRSRFAVGETVLWQFDEFTTATGTVTGIQFGVRGNWFTYQIDGRYGLFDEWDIKPVPRTPNV